MVRLVGTDHAQRQRMLEVADLVAHRGGVRPLAELLAVTFGPLSVLRDALMHVAGSEQAFIYGSWAAGYAEQPRLVTAEIDLLVVGEPDRDDLADVLEEAEWRLHRVVDVRRVRADEWARGTRAASGDGPRRPHRGRDWHGGRRRRLRTEGGRRPA